MTCPDCGGLYWIENLRCFGCTSFNDEWSLCDSDACPAFGIATEDRCRCSTNHANLPIRQTPAKTMEVIENAKHPAEPSERALRQNRQGEGRGREQTGGDTENTSTIVEVGQNFFPALGGGEIPGLTQQADEFPVAAALEVGE